MLFFSAWVQQCFKFVIVNPKLRSTQNYSAEYSVNYLSSIRMNCETNNFSVKRRMFLMQPTGTLGALDLGGASTQITFIPQQNIESDDNSIHFRLYGNNYHLYTHSFLCYGKDQALKLSMGKKLVSTHAAYKVCLSLQSKKCVEAIAVRAVRGPLVQSK